MSKNSDLTRETISTGPPKTQAASVIKNALKMAFGTMTSRVLGLFREVLLAALFSKHVTDAWAAAFRVPNLFRRLLGEGSLSVSFIPVFVDAEMDSKARAQNLVNTMYTILLIILAVITTLGLLFPHTILGWVLDAGYVAQTEKYELTVHMARIMFLFLFFISSFAFFMGILNALGEFFLPALAPTLWNLSMVISTIWPAAWLSERSKQNGDQLAWGVVIGGFLQCAILIPALVRKNYFPRLTTVFKNGDALRVFKNMVPGLIGTGLLQFTTIINLRFSSSLPEGTISYINYIDRLIELPLSLISVSLGTALLPALSTLWAKQQKTEMAEQARRYLELNLLISIAASFGLFSLAQPFIQMLFGRGHFTTADVLISSQILQTYCWILVFASAVRVLTPAYYAVKNTWFPAAVSAACVSVHLVLAPYLMKLYQVHGLMLSTIVTAMLNTFFLLLFFERFIARFRYGPFFKSIGKFILIGIGVFFASKIYFPLAALMPQRSVYSAMSLLLAIAFSGLVFVVLSSVLKVEGVSAMLLRLMKKAPFPKNKQS